MRCHLAQAFPWVLAFASTTAAGQPGAPARKGGLPESIRIERNIAYAESTNPRQALDLLLPREPRGDRALPVVVAIHGGAFRMGEKSMALGEIVPLVASGDYAGVTINYRLSGEATWPAQVHDCKAAIRWIRGNADRYKLDPDRIGVIGSSAGGHLAAMLGTSGAIASLEGDLGAHGKRSSKVRCVVDQFGPSDLLSMNDAPGQMDHNAPDSPESQLIGGTLQEHKEKARAASPISYVSPEDPPFLILHGTKDPLVPFNQSERLDAALKEAGVETYFVPIEGAGHGGFGSPEVPRRIRQFFDKHLRGQDVGPISDGPIEN